MEQIYLKARAKVNLNLEIMKQRKDQYHEIKSVFQKINLYDELYIQKIKEDKLVIQSNIKELNNKENIIYKAYSLLKEKDKNITGVEVKLNKRIPMIAGLAGGSTDCASFLLGMNQLFDLKLTKTEFEEIGKSLGADVVPCFYNKALVAEGIGEIVKPIDTHFTYYFVIIKPEISCDTKEMYQKINEEKSFKYPEKIDKMKQALEQNQIEEMANQLYNRFEKVVEEKEVIQRLKEELIEQGAIRKLNDRSRFLHFWNF